MLSIIIPARNEQHNLPKLLKSIKAQNIKPLEVLVIDDNSEDGTGDVATGYGARVIRIKNDISGWMGKSLACYTGAKAARGQLFMFLDADTWFEGQGLEKILACRQKYGGVLSIQPYHAIKRFYENFAIYFNLVLMSSMGVFTPLQKKIKPIGAFGPCLLIERETYYKLGGHKHTRDRVLEDLALGQKIVKAGIPLTCLGGKGTISFRMYPQGLKELVNGFAKGFSTGAKATSIINIILVVLWISAAFFPATAISEAASSQNIWILAAGIGFYLAYGAQTIWMARKIGNFHIIAGILYPVFLVFFIAIFMWSIIMMILGKKISWKNRKVKVN